MRVTCYTHGADEKYTQNFNLENLKGDWRNLVVDGSIMLKLILKIKDVRGWGLFN
jgi:hypothetical protein